MKTLEFDTDRLPESERLPTFRRAAADFRIDPIGPATAFRARWRMVQLGDMNVLRSIISPVSYVRDEKRIKADGEDRIAFHLAVRGEKFARFGDILISQPPAGASVWDMSRSLSFGARSESESLIVTVPRYLMAEVLPGVSLHGCLAASPRLRFAVERIADLLDHAEALPDAGAGDYRLAVRNMLAAAIGDGWALDTGASRPAAPVLVRIREWIDLQPAASFDRAMLAGALDLPAEAVERALAGEGGLAAFVERRRLLRAYRMLLDPLEKASIKRIAAACGFASLSHFGRRFAAAFETSPSALRKGRGGRLPEWAGGYHVDQDYSAMLKR